MTEEQPKIKFTDAQVRAAIKGYESEYVSHGPVLILMFAAEQYLQYRAKEKPEVRIPAVWEWQKRMQARNKGALIVQPKGKK